MEYVDPLTGFCIDSRRSNEMWKLKGEVGVVARGDGSTLFEMGNTRVIAAVYGPGEVQNKGQQVNSKEVLVRCDYRMAEFSTGDWRRKPKGGFDTTHTTARAYDCAVIKFRGLDADINFHLKDYKSDLKQMKNWTKEELVHILQRQSTGFARGSSKYRGVTLHKCSLWQAQMGQLHGKK